MVVEEKKAMKAIHRLLHQGRSLAFEGMANEQLAWYFGGAGRGAVASAQRFCSTPCIALNLRA